MSSGTHTRFKKQFTDSEMDEQKVGARDFKLDGIIDSKNIGKKKFSYASSQGQNFDETNVKKAREGAKEILADAIEKAKTKAFQVREEARKLGYDEGYQEGFKKGEVYSNQEFKPLFKAFDDHVRELSGFRKKMYFKLEQEMIGLVVALAKKVIRHELSVREDSIQAMIRLAVESVLDKENMNIKVHPADKDFAESFQPELHQLFNEIKNITFEANPALDRGGCMIETNFGTIDARLEHLDDQIDKILTLTPVAFDSEQTKFPAPDTDATTSEIEETSESAEEEKPEVKTEDPTKEDSGDIDDFDFPDLTDSDQQT